ncbi:ketosynthase chain-length factor, partial [Streptomyces sp. TRM76130]|nr:ketosynthase chain-length factor [Streptomyces sp. TRM76130]
MKQDVVVTGIGVTAPNGVESDAFWKSTLNGVSGIRPITRFDAAGYPVSVAGDIPEFDAEKAFTKKLMPQTDRLTRLSLFASAFALEDAAVRPDELPEFS